MDAAATLPPVVARRKALGAFYTPRPMAAKMVEWALRSPTDRALDPSFGGLVFLHAAHARLTQLGATAERASQQLFGCDIDGGAHASASATTNGPGVPSRALLHRDFFTAIPDDHLPRTDAVVGNPPYVRYQLHNSTAASARRVALAAGLQLTRMASSWAPFVLHSAEFVAPGGRLALVLPAELMHAQYADSVLSWVQRQFARAALVVFEQRVFPGALEEVVLLFAEGRGEGICPHVGLVQCDSMADFDLDVLARHLAAPAAKPRGRGKLLAQLLPDAVRDLHAELADDRRVRSLGSLASVDIGAVTGANDFFLLKASDEPAMSADLLRPAVSKAAHGSGARFSTADFERLRAADKRCMLFVATRETPDDVLASARSYLARGEASGIDTRYKCRVRTPWHAVPLPKHGTPDLFLTYCAADHPRIVCNEAGTLHTNTVHGVTVMEDVDPRALAVTFYNSLTLLSAELVGRSYGGGVLKLEPTEAEALLVPAIPASAAARLGEVDELVRARRMEDVLDLVDRLVLVEGLGLREADVALLRAGGERLRARRRARNKSPA